MSAPDLDAHQSEDGVGRIHASGPVIVNQPGDGGRVEEAATAERGGRQRVVHELPEIPSQPPAKRRPEPGLRPVDDLARQVPLDRLLQDPFAVTSALLDVGRQRIRKTDEIVVEERHAHFDSGGHRHLVRVQQVVIGEEEALFERQHLVQRRQALRQRSQVVLERGFYPLSREQYAVLRREQGADSLHVCPEEVLRQALLARRVGVRERLRNPSS